MPHDAQWDGGCGVFIELLTLPKTVFFDGNGVAHVFMSEVAQFYVSKNNLTKKLPISS
jgi:hypothetical protein